MVEVEQKITSSRKRDRVLSNFTPLWFSICMDTGILSILLHQLPYQFRGIRIISTIYFLLNIVLFVLFASIFLARIYRYGAEAKHDFGTNVDELMVLSCPIVGYSTLVAMTSMVTGQAWGSSWALFGYVMWWIAAFLSFSILFSSFYISCRNALLAKGVSATTHLPIVAILTAATVGGLVIDNSPVTPRMAVPIIIFGYMLVGMGIFLTMVIHAQFIHQDMTCGFFNRPRANPVDVLLIGPSGQASGALLSLAKAAQTYFGAYSSGTFLQSAAAAGLASASILLSLLLLGYSLILASIVLVRLLENIKYWTFSLAWWSLIFPFAVNINALISLSMAMDSPAFRGLATGLTLILIILWLIFVPLTLARLPTLLKLKENPDGSSLERASSS